MFLTYIHYRDACNRAVVDCRPTLAVIWSVSGTVIYFCFVFVSFLYVWDKLNKDIVLFEQGMIFCQWSDLLICKKSQMISTC